MSTSAPRDTNNSTNWILPFSAALCNGVIPDYKIICELTNMPQFLALESNL